MPQKRRGRPPAAAKGRYLTAWLDAPTREAIETLARDWNCSQGEVIRRSVTREAQLKASGTTLRPDWQFRDQNGKDWVVEFCGKVDAQKEALAAFFRGLGFEVLIARRVCVDLLSAPWDAVGPMHGRRVVVSNGEGLLCVRRLMARHTAASGARLTLEAESGKVHVPAAGERWVVLAVELEHRVRPWSREKK